MFYASVKVGEMQALTREGFLGFFKYSSPVMLLIDPNSGTIVDANISAIQFYGYPFETLIGLSLQKINTLSGEQIQIEQQRALKEERNFFNFSHRLSSGEIRDVEVYASPINIDGKILLFSIIHDITDRRIAEEALAQREILLKQILDTSSVAIFLVDMKGYIVQANERMCEMFGYPLDVLLTKEYVELIHPKEHKIGRAKMLALLGNKIPSVDLERSYWRRDGSEFWGHLSGKRLYSVQGEEIGLVGVIADITDKKAYEKQLEFIAHYDTLTKLPNRVLCFETLQSVQKQNKRFAIAYIDLDGFKEINDTNGHYVGDQFLIAISEQMRLALKEGDMLCRFGGDEFLAILIDVKSEEDVTFAIESLLKAASAPIEVEQKILNVSASIGVAFYPQDSEDVDTLVQQADMSMYRAKQSGKNRAYIPKK